MKENSFDELIDVMRVLRSENGCEWDKEQTHETLKPYMIEEAYEVLEAIENCSDKELKEELGDLLLQVIFHAQIARERAAFDIYDVIETLKDKLIRRHPHVFGDSEGYSYKQWEEIKAEEKGKNMSSSIGKLNMALPALSLARRVQENAAAVGFDWTKIEDVVEKVHEELEELKEARKKDDKNEIDEELGDLLFAMVNLSRFMNIDPEVSLNKATKKFMNRFEVLERLIKEDGKNINNMTLNELDNYWEKVKEGKRK
ncbi:MAG: nucleoside triphosphate pyrophosphohydrolase [Thermotogota bacterium]|nr:nucleoside triphosphate pyrophosphohydrolase [Thermotogota bacterium]